MEAGSCESKNQKQTLNEYLLHAWDVFQPPWFRHDICAGDEINRFFLDNRYCILFRYSFLLFIVLCFWEKIKK
jgi:hypothetical protein